MLWVPADLPSSAKQSVAGPLDSHTTALAVNSLQLLSPSGAFTFRGCTSLGIQLRKATQFGNSKPITSQDLQPEELALRTADVSTCVIGGCLLPPALFYCPTDTLNLWPRSAERIQTHVTSSVHECKQLQRPPSNATNKIQTMKENCCGLLLLAFFLYLAIRAILLALGQSGNSETNC